MSSHVKSSSYLGTALAEYAASNLVLSMLSTTTQYRWSTSIFTAGVCVCLCVCACPSNQSAHPRRVLWVATPASAVRMSGPGAT